MASRLPHFGVTRGMAVLFLTLALPVLVYGQCSQRPGPKEEQCCVVAKDDCSGGDCYCDYTCLEYEDCCEDYEAYCLAGAKCVIRGDPHIDQFDGDRFLFNGLCSYLLSETLAGATEQFNITGTFVSYQPGSNRTMIQKVLIHVRNMTIEMSTDGTVKVNNAIIVATTTPQVVGGGVRLFLDPAGFPRTVVVVYNVVKVELTTPVNDKRRKGHRVIITVPDTYEGQLNGLCGDYDGDSTDDANPCSGGPPADCFVDDGSCGA